MDIQDHTKTTTPLIEKKMVVGIEEKSYKSEDDVFSDAVTEFSGSGISTPGAEDRFIDPTKLLENLEVFVTPNKTQENEVNTEMKLPLDGPHKVDDVAYVLSVPSDIPLVDNAETLLQDFKDHKKTKNLTLEEKLHQSQPQSTMESEAVLESEQKVVGSVGVDTKDGGKIGISDSEGSEKIKEESVGVVSETLASQDVLVGSSSRNSLEVNWGSVSVLSAASVDGEPKDKIRLGKSDVFEGPLVGPKEEKVDQIKAVKVTIQDSQPPKSEAVGNEFEGRKRNKEAIAKVVNWSTPGHTKSPNPKQLPDMIQKDDVSEKIDEPKKSNLVKQELSPPKYIGEGKKVRKKSWIPFACCSSVNVN